MTNSIPQTLPEAETPSEGEKLDRTKRGTKKNGGIRFLFLPPAGFKPAASRPVPECAG
jgi:hypothetical protein